MAATKRGLGRGLSALIPDDDMVFLSQVARGDTLVPPPASPTLLPPEHQAHQPQRSETTGMEAGRPGTEADRPGSSNAGRDVEPGNASTTGAKPAAIVSRDASSSPPEPAPDRVSAAVRGGETVPGVGVEWVAIGAIAANPWQPRRSFHSQELQELAESVKAHGVLQPVLLRPWAGDPPADAGTVGEGTEAEGTAPAGRQRFQLVAGERRWRAAQAAGLTVVPAIVRAVSDQQALELALIENVQRQDISAIDAAVAYRRLSDEFSLSQDEIAQRVGKSRSAVANTMRLLDLPVEARKAIEDGVLSEGHGRAILLASGEGARRAVLRRVLRDQLSVRQTEQMARESASAGDAAGTPGAGGPSGTPEAERATLERELRDLEARLQKLLGARLRVRPRGKGGSVIIEYASAQELERLIDLLRAGAG